MSSSAHYVDYSAPNIDTIGGVQITRLPAGEAIGSNDLRWSSNRSAGRSGAHTTRDERQVLQNWSKSRWPRRLGIERTFQRA